MDYVSGCWCSKSEAGEGGWDLSHFICRPSPSFNMVSQPYLSPLSQVLSDSVSGVNLEFPAMLQRGRHLAVLGEEGNLGGSLGLCIQSIFQFQPYSSPLLSDS